MTFDTSTHIRLAPGSDNWPITWADDGHQYTSWGDGGGFGGTNSDGRVSLGVGRVEGSTTSYTGFNVWGGKNSENPAQFDGKSYGILSVAGVLYMWVSPGSDATGYTEARLAFSTNHGATWTKADWAFVKADNLVFPTFLQFGQDYAGSRDNYVYSYAIRLKDGSALTVQKPGEIDLMRVPKDRILDRTAYQFFAGLDDGGNPTWTASLSARQPIFKDPNGVGWNLSVSYNAGLGRYILATEHEQSMQGNLGLFDAPSPWGPWTTVGYYSNWAGFGTTFYWNFSNKWLSLDGKSFTLIFTGTGANDSWNSIRGQFTATDGTQANRSPTANPDSYSVAQNSTLTVAAPGVLGNDSDPDGDPLTASLVSGPANGALTLNSNGSFSYTPQSNFTGADSFTYRASDGKGGSATATVSITVTAASAGLAGHWTFDEGSGLTAADSSGNGNSGTLVNGPTWAAGQIGGALNLDGSNDYVQVADSASLDITGDLSIAAWVKFDALPSSGSARYPRIVQKGNSASSTVYYLAVDTINGNKLELRLNIAGAAYNTRGGVSLAAGQWYHLVGVRQGNQARVYVNGTLDGSLSIPTGALNTNNDPLFLGESPGNSDGAVDGLLDDVRIYSRALSGSEIAALAAGNPPPNNPPTANADSYTVAEDGTVSAAASVLANDSDPDGDPLTASLVSGPSNGTLSLNSNGSFTYTPAANFNGSDAFTYQASDGKGGTANATVSITVTPVNDAPVAVNDSYQVNQGGVLDVVAELGVLENDSDVDGDPLTAGLVSGPANGTLTLNPDGSFSYSPNAGFAGSDSFTYQARDAHANSNSATVSITVTAASSELAVTIPFVSTGKTLGVVGLAVGALAYVDRSYTITGFSAGLAGGTLVQTANNDKSVTAAEYIRLSVNQEVTVYVGYDRRSSSRPDWLSAANGWAASSESLSDNDGAGNPAFLVYEKTFAAGDVSLGGNLATGAAGAKSTYVVVVKGTGAAANQAPTVATAAAASPSSVTGATTNLSVLGSDDGGEANLTYTWTSTGPAAVSFSANGSNAAKNTTATFSRAGSYSFTVTIKDAGGLTTTSSVSVMVNQTLTNIVVAPGRVTLNNGQTQQFTASAKDQFGNAMSSQPAVTWTIDAGGVGTLSTSGLYTAPASGTGSATVRAASGSTSGTAAVMVSTSSELTVTITSVSTGKAYDTTTAQAGVVYYIDRSYTISSLPATLAGSTLIRTANNDKSVTTANHLTFSLNAAATVYVAYDSRGTVLPAWLNDGTWSATGQTVGTTDVTLRLYAKGFQGGSVTLGGNLQAPASGAASNYVVFVKAAEPLRAAEGEVLTSRGKKVTKRSLKPIIREAQARWVAAGADPAAFRGIRFRITNLPGDLLGYTLGSTIWIDRNAAGYGWYIDKSPKTDSEFSDGQGPNRIDLLSAVLHELGHSLGFPHDDGPMAATLAKSTRISAADLAYFFQDDNRFGRSHGRCTAAGCRR